MTFRKALALLALAVTAGGCSADGLLGQKACTDVGCSDGFSVTLRPTGGLFPAGTHELFVATPEGGPARHCLLVVPPTGPGDFVKGDCVGGIDVNLSPEVVCTTTTDHGASSQSCVAVVGRFEESVSITGTPARMRLIQRTSEATVLDREVTPSYRDTFPNGEGCPPVCRQAKLEANFSFDDRPSPPVACAPSVCRRDADCKKLGGNKTRCMQQPLTGPCVLYACE